MLSIERVKELIADQNLSSQDAEKVRDELRALAEIIFEQWMVERQKLKNNN